MLLFATFAIGPSGAELSGALLALAVGNTTVPQRKQKWGAFTWRTRCCQRGRGTNETAIKAVVVRRMAMWRHESRFAL